VEREQARRNAKFGGLVHRFNPPTAEHKRKYNRAISQTRVIGDARSGTTVFQGRQRLLVEFYDQLIASVEGYALRGQPLASPEQIRAEMDAVHKIVAVQQLFASPAMQRREAGRGSGRVRCRSSRLRAITSTCARDCRAARGVLSCRRRRELR
jgi:hypothetical protein